MIFLWLARGWILRLCGLGLLFPVFFCVREFAGFGDFSVAEGLHNFEDLSPGGEGAVVLLFVLFDGHQELELLIGHLSLFSGLSVVGSASSGAAASVKAGDFRGGMTAVKARAAVNDVLPAVVFAAVVSRGGVLLI